MTVHETLVWVLEYEPADVDAMLEYAELRVINAVLECPAAYEWARDVSVPFPIGRMPRGLTEVM